MSQNYDLFIELCDQIAKLYFHTSCYSHQINFLQYLALRILFAMWVMYRLGYLLWLQDKLWLMISKCSYIENNFIQNSVRFTHNIDLQVEVIYRYCHFGVSPVNYSEV